MFKLTVHTETFVCIQCSFPATECTIGLCTFVLALMLKDIAHYAPCCIKKAFWVKICIKTLQTPHFSGNRAHATSRTTNSHVTSTYARAHACALPLLSARRTSQELWLVLSCSFICVFFGLFFFVNTDCNGLKVLERKLACTPWMSLQVFEEFAQHAADKRLFGFCLITLLRCLLDHFRHCIQKEKAAQISCQIVTCNVCRWNNDFIIMALYCKRKHD